MLTFIVITALAMFITLLSMKSIDGFNEKPCEKFAGGAGFDSGYFINDRHHPTSKLLKLLDKLGLLEG